MRQCDRPQKLVCEDICVVLNLRICYSARVMNYLRALAVSLSFLFMTQPVWAAEEAVASERPVVAEVLSNASCLTKKKPNLKAKYYMFLRSASWCVPCQFIVPKLLKDYGKMRTAQMELILLGQEDEAAVKAYMKEHKYKCPGVMGSVASDIPGIDFSGFGLPSACIVTADGQFVAKSGGIHMYEWKKQLKEYQMSQLRKKSESQQEE